MTAEYILRAAVKAIEQGRKPHCYSAHMPGRGYVNDGNIEGEAKADYIRQATRNAQSIVDSMEWAEDYAEPGYDKPVRGIFFANWNGLPDKVTDLLERQGYAIEWSDEWSTCENCNRAVRTSPDSYGWRRSFAIVNDCELLCADCLHEEPETLIAELLNDPTRADTTDLDLASHGFTRFNPEHYENGFHPGQNDDPKAIAKALPADVDFIFQIPSVGQFDIAFDVWTRPKNYNDEEN